MDDAEFSRREHELPRPGKRSVPEYVGLSEAAARQLAQERGRPFRVAGRDGVGRMLTADLVYGRIDAWVENGLVVQARETYDRVTGTISPQGKGPAPT